MATTITLDDETALLVEQEAQRAHQTLSEAVSRVFKHHLGYDVRQQPPEPFVVKPFNPGLPPEWTSHKVDDLLDMAEGPNRRW